MSLMMQVALTVGPLAGYFFIVGAWQSGRHPRVVAGPVDFAVLLCGVSGLLTGVGADRPGLDGSGFSQSALGMGMGALAYLPGPLGAGVRVRGVAPDGRL